jgi:hypothetical protein
MGIGEVAGGRALVGGVAAIMAEVRLPLALLPVAVLCFYLLSAST